MRIVTLPGVFAPRSDTWLLADVLRGQATLAGADVLELGTGSGAIAIAAARGGARSVTVVDLSRRALVCAQVNARLNGTRVRARHGDLFAPVAGEQFDIVVSNPPYLPGRDQLPARGAARAWEGGSDGRSVLERICAGVADHLRPGGTVLLMQSSINGLSRTLDALEHGGLRADVVARRRGPLGPLLRARAGALRARGLLDADGPLEEELLVVRGRRVAGRPPAVPTEGSPMPPRGVKKGTKRARQYEHIKDSLRDQGRSEDTAEEIAARTVNKEKARAGESRTRSRSSVQDISSGRRGGLRSGTNRAKGPTRDQLYNEARQLGIDGRSKMNKDQLKRAVARKKK